MGLGRKLFLECLEDSGDLRACEENIAKLKREIRGGEYADEAQDRTIKRLAEENSELKLYLASLIRLLILKGTFSRTDFERFVDIVDASDGKLDNRFDGEIEPKR